jgi:CBS domain-containing protein
MGMGGDEDDWTWEGIRDTVRLYYSTTQVDLPPVAVKEVMVTNVIKAYRNTPIPEIAKNMVKHKISHVPVVDSENRLVGMVTDLDLMACIFKSC